MQKTIPNAQFVVVNYGTNEHTAKMRDWIHDNFQDEITSGKLKYVEYPEAKAFASPHAKNIAHRMADGDVLCNIDSDQFIGQGFARDVAAAFENAEKHSRRIFMRHSSMDIARTNEHQDSLGKIVVSREDYYANRGYNEQIVGWAGADGDFMAKMLTNGVRHVAIPLSYAHGISHSDTMRVDNLDPEIRERSLQRMQAIRAVDGKSTFVRVLDKGRRAVTKLTDTLLHERNPDGFGMGEVYVNFSSAPVTLALPQPQERAAVAMERV